MNAGLIIFNDKVKAHSIPPELIINVDQTPSLYVSVGKQTMSAWDLNQFLLKV